MEHTDNQRQAIRAYNKMVQRMQMALLTLSNDQQTALAGAAKRLHNVGLSAHDAPEEYFQHLGRAAASLLSLVLPEQAEQETKK